MGDRHIRSDRRTATVLPAKTVFAFLLFICLASAAAEINATVSATVISRATIFLDSFNISSPSVTHGGSVSFNAAFNNNGNSNDSFTIVVYLINQNNVTVQTITFSPVVMIEGESAVVSRSVAISAAPGNYAVLAIGSYSSYSSNNMTSNLNVSAAPLAPAINDFPFFFSVPSATLTSVDRPIVTTLDLTDGEQLSISFYPSGEEVRAYSSQFGSGLTGITGIALTSDMRMTDSRIIIRVIPMPYPAGVPDPPPTLYSRLSVETININPLNIKSLSISFKVPRSWENSQFDKNSIALYRFADSKWNRLPTSLIGSDDKFFYYVATSPGLSYFAIVAEVPQPFSVTSYPMVEETPPGRTVTHTIIIRNPSAEMSSGSVSLSGVPQEWVVDPVRTVSVAPFSSLDVSFIIFVPLNAILGESALLTDVLFGGSEKSILTVLRVVGPKESGVYVYRTIIADTEKNETRVSLYSENSLQTRADVVEVTDKLPLELQSSRVYFTTEPTYFADGTVNYMFSLDPGGKRVDEFVLGSLFDSYSIYLNWLVDQVSTVSYPAYAIEVQSLSATSFAPAGRGTVNLSIVNRGTIDTTVVVKLSLPDQWLAIPMVTTGVVSPRSVSEYIFEVTAPASIEAGTYSGKAIVAYGESSLEAALPLVVTIPSVTVIETGGLAESTTTLVIAIAFVAVLIVLLLSFKKSRRAKAK